MTINERVSDDRLSTLANLQSPECMALPAGHNEVAMLARELQQYRAAAEPIYQVRDWHWYDTEKHVYDEAVARGDECRVLYAAPQVTSVPDEVIRDALRYRFLRDKDAFGCDNEPGLAGWDDLVELEMNAFDAAIDARMAHSNARCAAMLTAAPAVQAEQLSGNTEQVSEPNTLPVIGWVRADYQDENRRGDSPLFVFGKKDPSAAWGVPYLRVGNSPLIPDGYALVPIEPTAEMLNAAWVSYGIYHPSAYRAMIAAAPKQEAE